jgi:hypothetical protein
VTSELHYDRKKGILFNQKQQGRRKINRRGMDKEGDSTLVKVQRRGEERDDS